jgi:hypothetical protein
VDGVVAVGETRDEVEARMADRGPLKAGPEVRLELSKTEVNSDQLR